MAFCFFEMNHLKQVTIFVDTLHNKALRILCQRRRTWRTKSVKEFHTLDLQKRVLNGVTEVVCAKRQLNMSAIQNYLIFELWNTKTNKQPPWSESASELHRPSDRRLSAKWLVTFADRGCHMVSVTEPYGRILDFLDRSRYFSIK
jgi:hypothetical protein